MNYIFLSEKLLLQIHEETLNIGNGLKSKGNPHLDKILEALPNAIRYSEQELTIWDLAAILLEKIIQSHPFPDANKRTAYISTKVFLKLNGKELTCSDEIALELVIKVAKKEIDHKKISQILLENSNAL